MARASIGISVFLSVLAVVAQTPAEATCDSSFSWAFNSKNQSPCEVAEALAAPCHGGQFNIPAIGAGQAYSGPTREAQSDCRCNTVFYSMLSACAACQGREWARWSGFNGNCSTVYPGLYPHDLPAAVPAYAYENITASDLFNITEAQNLVSLHTPESTQAPQSTGAASSTTLPSISIAAPSPTQDPSPEKKTNVGAIAGGTVGGVVFLVLLVGGLVWFLRRRRIHKQSQRTAILGEPKSYHNDYNTTPTPFAGHGLPGSPSTRTDADGTYGSPYTVADRSLDTNYNNNHPYDQHALERRASSPEI